MVTVVMAYFFLKETLTTKQVVMLIGGFSAVMLVIYGGDENSDNLFKSNFIELLLLFMNPLAVATGQIVMRKMRSTSEWTVTLWVYIMQTVCLTPFVFYSERNYIELLFDYGWATFGLLILMSVFQIAMQTFKFRAMKYYKVAAL